MAAQRARWLVLFSVSALLFVACGSEERPSPADWTQSWQELVDAIPQPAELGDPPAESLCQSTLADIRRLNEELRPTPSVTIDELAGEWVSIAETAFFECPPREGDVDSFEDAYRELGRVEDLVRAALADL